MHISAPGKLFLSGEWAVLELGNPGIVTAVNKRVHVEINELEDESDKIHVSVKDFEIEDVTGLYREGKVVWENATKEEEEKLIFMKGALESVLAYVGFKEGFSIKSWGEDTQLEIDGQKKKIGFGSSAAAVVAVISSVMALNGYDISEREIKDKIYKMAALAHYLAQGKVGSSFDVAASTYGGVFIYERFDPAWVIKNVEEKGLKNTIDSKWPSFKVEELEIPKDFKLLIGFTGDSASSSAMVKQMNGFKESNSGEYNRIYGEITSLVKELIEAWKKEDKEKILELISKNEKILAELGEKSGVNIEVPELKVLSEKANEAGGAGKLSGAGGGDCGIAVCFDTETSKKIKKEWKDSGIHVIHATMDRKGVIMEL